MSFDDKLFEYTLNATKEFETGFDKNPVVPFENAVKAIEAFDEPMPLNETEALDVMKMLHEIGTPATTLSRSGRFFGFVVGGTLPVAQASNWLTTAWDQNAALTVLGYPAAKLEQVSRKWIVEMLNLPSDVAMGFVSGATMAGFTALSSARIRIYKNQGYDLKKSGLKNAPDIKIIVNADIHATNITALGYMGYGRDEIIFSPVDDQGRIIVDQLPDLDENTIILLQAGNINSGAFDDFKTICAMAKKTGSWVHLDGAFGGWLKVSPTRGHLADGMELADSWSIDCHKWLNVPYDSAIAICRDRDAMREAFTISASYSTTDGERIPNNYTPELSRRARGVDVWAALKHLGKNGLGGMIDRCCDHAKYFARELEQIGFTIMNDVVINQIVFCLNDNDDERLDRIFKHVNASGKAWFGSTHWRGRTVYRMSIISHETTKDDLKVALDAIKDAMKV